MGLNAELARRMQQARAEADGLAAAHAVHVDLQPVNVRRLRLPIRLCDVVVALRQTLRRALISHKPLRASGSRCRVIIAAHDTICGRRHEAVLRPVESARRNPPQRTMSRALSANSPYRLLRVEDRGGAGGGDGPSYGFWVGAVIVFLSGYRGFTAG
ncbi:MAG: hypothetical protein EDS66_06790 [Planctomycetota bacterium]|nr:MAG: hypothetical protein EDS66_06790 [Planctomycetota bacterium]